MPRKWTARKVTSVDEHAIDGSKFRHAIPMYRGDPDAQAGTKQALRLVTAFLLLWLPVHAGIYWLAGFSLGLAAAAVALVAGALLIVALAKWLSLEDLLQKLPLLLVLALLGVGFSFTASEQPRRWGAELFGSVVFLFVAVSVLGGLYRPLAAAYQVVTVQTPFRDLCVGAVAMLVSLVLAALAQFAPRPLLEVLGFAVSGGFAGLVVLEYAAWARANPNVSLERAQAFHTRTDRADGAAGPSHPPASSRTTIQGACAFGLGFGLLTTAVFYLATPSAEINRLLHWGGGKPEDARQLLACWLVAGVALAVGGFCVTSSSLHALRLADPSAAFRLAWDAIRVFLTYPEVTHPLAHRLRLSWLRPVPLRLALAGVTLVTVATSVIASREKPNTARDPKPPASAEPVARPPSLPPFAFPGDGAFAGAPPFGDVAGDPFAPRLFAPHQPIPAPPTTPIDRAAGSGIAEFVLGVISAAVVPPLLLYAMVWLLGLSVLPTHFDYFERPQTPG